MPRKIFYLLILLFLILNSSCKQKTELKYLALGDSYTIGESVPEDQRWPVQLASKLRNERISISKPDIIATTGWTTDELQEKIDSLQPDKNYDLVSLLIGVNNQYRGYPIDQYIKEFEELLNDAISFAGNEATRVFVVSIPNYGVTPFGILKGEDIIRQELLRYDAIADSISNLYEIPFINITPSSEKAKNDLSYIAKDELHPSGKQYSEWVESIIPVVKSIIKSHEEKSRN